ncbi:Hpt domain-containing protein [Roseiconus lacunae]|uniref:Hpt domain-containing protein n=1 Tax=Roseiconus lacunae TaxID=2605694 RepID=A0ABT7PEM7_9BACT|nr:Hpt domain-containing protein [Roseiconus lacunae]MDM4014749.1 Hpt domain-containing protein [Roseiconus lacunae]
MESGSQVQDNGLFDELIIDFVDSLDEYIHHFDDFVESKDLESLGKEAHKLKGCSGTLGFQRIRLRSELLEHQVKAALWEEIIPSIEGIREEIQAVDIEHIRQRQQASGDSDC